MRYVQSIIFVAAALLAVWGGLVAIGDSGQGIFTPYGGFQLLGPGPVMGFIGSFVWGLQLLGIGSILLVLAFAAVSPDRPASLKRRP